MIGDCSAPAPTPATAPGSSIARVEHGRGAELHADPEIRVGHLGNAVAPGPLTRAAHHEEVAAAELEHPGRAAAHRLQLEATSPAEGDDGHDGVVPLPAEPIAVERDAVPAVPVGGERHRRKGAAVAGGERIAKPGDDRM